MSRLLFRTRSPGRLLASVGLFGLAACSGVPLEPKDFAGVDMDGDGYTRFNDAGQIVDCNDLDAAVNPASTDDCDGVDTNCNGIVDDEAPYYYADRDGDGYGRPDDIQRACAQPAGYVAESSDCDDDDADRSPGAVEVCDDKDNDCNNIFDDIPADGAPTLFYVDADGDGYGDPRSPVGSCDSLTPPVSGVVDNNGDCLDSVDTAFPGSTTFEVTGDGIDQDCDGEDACVDLDCDGISDVVVGWADDDLLPWLEGEASTGSGQLVLARSAATGIGAVTESIGPDGSTSDFVVADVDGDGYPDVVQAVTRDSLDFPFEESYVHFGPFATDPPAEVGDRREPMALSVAMGTRVAVADFDANGVADVVIGATEVGDMGGSPVFVDVGDAAGDAAAVEPDVFLPTAQVHALVAADFDGDGFDDLAACHGAEADAVTGHRDYDLLVYFGGAGGLDLAAPAAPTDGCIGLAPGDLDGDGRPELVVLRGYDITGDAVAQLPAQVVRVDTDQSVDLTATFETDHAGSVQLEDVDQDGDLDVIFGAGPLLDVVADTLVVDWDTEVQIHLNSGAAVSAPPDIELVGHGAVRPVFGFFNSDDTLDLVAPGQATGSGDPVTTYVYYGTGGSDVFEADRGILRSWPAWLYGTALDYDDDGATDILASGVDDSFGLKLLEGSAAGLTETAVDLQAGPVLLRPPLVVP